MKETIFCKRERPSVGYGVAWVRRIEKNIGLFCKRALQKRLYSAKETCNLVDPTDRSHPICMSHVTHMNESRHICTSYATYEWITSHMSRSCCLLWDLYLSHVTHMNESRHICTSYATYQWVTSHMNRSCCLLWDLHELSRHMNESRHIWISQTSCEWVTSHVHESRHMCMSHVTYE